MKKPRETAASSYLQSQRPARAGCCVHAAIAAYGYSIRLRQSPATSHS